MTEDQRDEEFKRRLQRMATSLESASALSNGLDASLKTPSGMLIDLIRQIDSLVQLVRSHGHQLDA